MLGQDCLVNVGHLALGALDGHVRLESRYHAEVTARATGERIGDRIAEDAPDLCAGRGDVVEALRHDADDGHLRAAHRDRLPDDAGVAAEPSLPERMAHYNDARDVRHVLVGPEVAPERRLDA